MLLLLQNRTKILILNGEFPLFLKRATIVKGSFPGNKITCIRHINLCKPGVMIVFYPLVCCFPYNHKLQGMIGQIWYSGQYPELWPVTWYARQIQITWKIHHLTDYKGLYLYYWSSWELLIGAFDQYYIHITSQQLMMLCVVNEHLNCLYYSCHVTLAYLINIVSRVLNLALK